MRTAAIIPAAGQGRRMGGVRKALLEVAGRPLLQYSVEALLAHEAVERIVVALSPEDLADAPVWLRQAGIQLVAGGAERADSVRNGLRALPPEIDAVLVHDAARPLIGAALIDRVLEQVRTGVSATVAIPVTDTLHETNEMQDIVRTPDRGRYWRAQTPQGFPRGILEEAFETLPDVSAATDEAGLVAAGGWTVKVVHGEPWNVKVTTPDDVALVESFLAGRRR